MIGEESGIRGGGDGMGGEAGQSGEREETGGYLERAGPGVVMI